jgi:hypothetical protein
MFTAIDRACSQSMMGRVTGSCGASWEMGVARMRLTTQAPVAAPATTPAATSLRLGAGLETGF